AVSTDDVSMSARLARQALEGARDDTDTMARAAFMLFFLVGETALAETVLDRALTLNPNAATAWMIRGYVHVTGRGQPEAAIAALEQAMRLSPFDPLGYLTTVWIALSHLVARRFEQAIEWADRALHDQPRLATAMRTRVVAYAELARPDEARSELKRVLD